MKCETEIINQVVPLHFNEDDILTEYAPSIAAALRHISQQRTLLNVSTIVKEHLSKIFPDTNSDCVFHDSEMGVLWRENTSDEWSCDIGLIGAVAKSRNPSAIPITNDDPRYEPKYDPFDPENAICLAMHPLLGRKERVNAVLILFRDEKKPFFPTELFVFSYFSEQIEIIFETLSLEQISETANKSINKADLLYDPKALAAHREGNTYGIPIVFPKLTSRYRLIVSHILTMALAMYICTVKINLHASGPAMISSSRISYISSPFDGVVENTIVEPGQHVEKGQPILYLKADREKSELEKAEIEFNSMLALRLLRPTDNSVEEKTAAALTDMNHKYNRVQERTLLAPKRGIIQEANIVAGQTVKEDSAIVSLVEYDNDLIINAAIPSRYLPKLSQEQEMRFEIDGYPHVYLKLSINKIGSIVGSNEAEAVLSHNAIKAIALDESMVIVQGVLKTSSFKYSDVLYRINHGMKGTVVIKLKRERLIVVLFPFLQKILNND